MWPATFSTILQDQSAVLFDTLSKVMSQGDQSKAFFQRTLTEAQGDVFNYYSVMATQKKKQADAISLIPNKREDTIAGLKSQMVGLQKRIDSGNAGGAATIQSHVQTITDSITIPTKAHLKPMTVKDEPDQVQVHTLVGQGKG
jgi:hypothetical protein